jgi:hypothetical protein
MDKNDVLPFGLLFEESIIPNQEIVAPIYDETEGITIIIDENGNKKPYVEWHKNVGTKTATKVEKENMDDDEPPNTVGTRTITEVREEVSDVDDMVNLFLGTKTATAVKSEQPDDDPKNMLYEASVLGTKTKTKQSGEGTDSDE